MSDSATDLTAVRAGHEFDENALLKFMEANVEGFAGPMQVLQFDGGQSNPTFKLEAASGIYVLRKQPPGELLPSAHQVDREYRIMKALWNTPVPVPKMHALCEDLDVIGVKFYIMALVEGRVYSEILLPGCSVDDRQEMYLDMMRVGAAIHAVDYQAVGLETFGRPGNYYERQISRWSKQYNASKTEEIASMEKLLAWVPAHLPESNETTIAHGDFRMANMVYHPTEPRIVAVLDWELSTLGHPLADIGYSCMEFNADFYGEVRLRSPERASLGIPSEEEMVAEYCRASGRDTIDNWKFYVIYNLFRSAAIVQGVYKRGLDGNASSESALTYGDECRNRADRAWELVEEYTGAN
jgi:aminoglycoside phosphotransferase (APT) family kinase protein